MNAAAAATLGVTADDAVRVTQGDHSAEFSVTVDAAVPDGCIWLPTAVPGTEQLGPGFGAVGPSDRVGTHAGIVRDIPSRVGQSPVASIVGDLVG